jgi:hypothetical protein
MTTAIAISTIGTIQRNVCNFELPSIMSSPNLTSALRTTSC